MPHKVLVVDVNAIGMVAVIRSLGAAGYTVHATAPRADALGLHSRFADFAVCCPPMNSPDFLPWMRRYIDDNEIEAIFPSEGFLHAISDSYAEYAALLPDAVPIEIWQRCLSKVASQSAIKDALPEDRHHLPEAGVIADTDSLPPLNAIVDFDHPVYIKADAGLARTSTTAHVVRCESVEQILSTVENLLPDYQALLWQRYVPGKKVGVSLWRHDNEFLAENMTLGIHMQPWTGGMMSLRESFWHPRLLADAKEKMEVLGWQGVAMMEYKWDPTTDEFWFIEINARYWGYLHLDLYSGKNFPKLQADAFFGNVQSDMGPPAKHLRCRHTVPGDLGYVMSRVRSPELGHWEKCKSIAGFVLRFFDYRTKSDLWYPGDRTLYIRSWINYLKDFRR